MVKKKLNRSLFSTISQQINNKSSAEYHLIDSEYYIGFNSIDDIQQFHNKLIEKQTNYNNEKDNNQQFEQDNNEIDMKTFAQKYLIDLPETLINNNKNLLNINQTNYELNTKRQRRNIKDLPQSSNFLFMSDDDNGNIFDSLTEKKSSLRTNRIAYEDMSSILLTLDVKKSKKKKSLSKTKNQQEPIIAIELAEPSMIKNEPIEQEQLVITHVIETKEEPVQINVIPTGPMSFGTSEYSHDLDNYVQNIHRSCTTNVSISPSSSLLRPKRIRKRKKFYIEESETNIKSKRKRKKPSHININSTLLTDAEIEQQFGERLSPTIKLENHNEIQHNINNHIIIETQSISETPIEKARKKLINALGRGHDPDTFLLKIRSRENKIFEIELAIYSTTDWYSSRSKILSKVEEALRGLRVSWTKIDIRVDYFDVQICTSSQTTSISTLSTNMNSSWFLKVLSESGPLIVHIHDRRHPQQRHFIKCLCSQCSSHEQINDSSLPIIVSVSPVKLISNRYLSSPTILRKTSQIFNSTIISSLYNIHTKFFQDLIYQYGTNTISSITQCIFDLTLIVSVHSSLSYFNTTNDDYEKIYQHIIDPLKYTMNLNENMIRKKYFIQPDILIFYQTIKKNKANIRNAQSMKNIIFNTILQTSNVIKTTELILPKQTINRRSLIMNRCNKRQRNQILNNSNYNGVKQQAHFTPIIELKPILGGSTSIDECDNDEPIRKVTKIISTNTIQKDSQRINTITTREITPRVIRLSINKPPSLPTNSIRLVTSTTSHPIASVDKIETSPLVPKQINIIKPLSSSITPAIKLANPILISNKSQQPSMN
ncbi:unnamed protein product [Rotaria sp. Silwood1]|nr:unnamed protein product [Rotaria sp. Silwood1]CAF1612035.1 unnamed protein product [Rotaria sp. Silwood1]CAF3723534.1 unnamed protein product [Rotaria sp. Silwood1]CAF4968917.1 unnamed protein product [Rotaria sp. Silwood1]